MSAPRLTPILVLAATLLYSASAQAAFTSFTLVSGDPARHLQADYAYDPAISADGRYVAFTGSVGSQPGIFRTELRTNLATGEEEIGNEETVALGGGTGAPSISADGRYVSFTTSDDPRTGAPTSDGCTQVYRRDMDQEGANPPAYTLVSVLNGPEAQPLTYAGSGQPNCPGGGSASSSRVALSASGNEVAFTVLGQSNLTQSAMPTPPDQIAVRNIDSGTTTLVSATRASLGGTPQPVPSGAALAGVTSGGGVSLPGGGRVKLAVAASTAAISADGSTVAWMGVDITEQAPVTQPPQTVGFVDGYAEPLWRRISDGPTVPTRRVLAGDDASAPGCPPECSGGLNLEWDPQKDPTTYSGKTPVYGSYTEEATRSFEVGAGVRDPIDAVTPKLSADGMTVALLSTQPNYGGEPLVGEEEAPANAFVVNMVRGLTRAQAITRLTEWGSIVLKNTPQDGAVENIAISPDGSRVAFTTQRLSFPLAPPALITPPVSQVGSSQLYEANLAGGTLALVSQGYNGEPANGNVFATAFSGDGTTLALASAAGNLAFGAVSQGSDVYVTKEIDPPVVAGVQSVTPLPLHPEATVSWQISATARPSPDGALLIDVSVPGAGLLTASASASVPTTVTAVSRTRKRAHAHILTARRHNAAARHARKLTKIATHQVAHAQATSKGVELVQLRLTPVSHYRALISGRNGLYATINVTFTAPGHPRLNETVQASFQLSRIYKLSKPKSKPAKRKSGKPLAKRKRK